MVTLSFGEIHLIMKLFVVGALGGVATPVSGQFSDIAELDQRSLSVEEVSAQARVVAQREALLSVEMGGRVESLNVAEGGTFQDGEVLVELGCGVERGRLEKTNAILEEAVEIREANEQLAKLRSVGDLELALSRVRTVGAEADVAVASAEVERCAVRAPFDGVVARVRKREAEYIQIGEPLLEVIDPTALEVEFLAPSAWLAWLDRDQPFTLRLNELPLQLRGQVRQIGVRVDPVTRKVRVKGRLTGDLSGVVPGMSGNVHLEVAE